jgi:hypothetical protein
MIYKLRADNQNYMNFYIDPYEIHSTIGDYFLLDQPKWDSFWKKLPATFSDDSDKGDLIKVPDITVWIVSACLALNQKSYEILKNMLMPHGEFLPAECEGVPYWVYHLTNKTGFEFVDLEKSHRTIDEGEYIEMQSLVFKEDKLDGMPVFQSEFNLYRDTYCTEQFKSLVESAGLQGLYFSTDLACINEL